MGIMCDSGMKSLVRGCGIALHASAATSLPPRYVSSQMRHRFLLFLSCLQGRILRYVTVGDRLVDPGRAGHLGCPGAAGEAPRVRSAGGVQHGLALLLDRGRGADMDRVRGVQPDPGMPVLVVVIGEEHAAERAGVLQ